MSRAVFGLLRASQYTRDVASVADNENWGVRRNFVMYGLLVRHVYTGNMFGLWAAERSYERPLHIRTAGW